MAHRYLPVDLHCHSTNSDGSLQVKELLTLAKNNGCQYLALTDHDTIEGIAEAKSIAQDLDLKLIPGVEISVTWNNSALVHILGLGVDETNQILVENLKKLRNQRPERGKKIAEKLARVGISNAYEGAMKYCNDPHALSRTHFSQFLIANGHAKPGKAFEKYLAPGKVAYVAETWATLKDAVSWIINSGGIAVIAHPCRYNFTRTKLLKLIEEFKNYGGEGIEVISSSHSLNDIQNIAAICLSQNLLASMGSDFHSIESFRKIHIGENMAIPDGLFTVFDKLNITIDSGN